MPANRHVWTRELLSNASESRINRTAIYTILITLVAITNFGSDYWFEKWAICLQVMSLILGYIMYRKYHLSVGVLYSYALVTSIYIWCSRMNWYNNSTLLDILLTRYLSAQGAAAILLLTTPFLFATKRDLYTRIPIALIIFICLNGLWCIVQKFLGGSPRGVFLNLSMNGGFSAILAPVVFYYSFNLFKIGWAILINLLVLSTVLLSGATMPFVTYMGGMFFTLTYFILAELWKEKKFRKFLYLIPIGAAALGIGYLLVPEFFSTNDRAQVWIDASVWWFKNAPFFTGTGLGTLQYWLPHVQGISHKYVYVWFIWLHNDPLQIIFELGFLGGVFALWVYATALYRARHAPPYLASLLALGIFSLGNFPLHNAVHAFVATWLIAASIGLRGKANE